MSPVRVVDYDPEWPRIYESLRQNIATAVGELALAIEHVGSTAVPGLAAKPVIDLDVVVRADDVVRVIDCLAALGYEHEGDLGVPGREAFRAPAGSYPHHLYVCRVDGPALANHLAVRDHLRASAAAAQAYGALKRQLARAHADDMTAYVEGKTAFILAILRERGFPETVLAEIEGLNRRGIGE